MAQKYWRCYGKNCPDRGAQKPGFDFFADYPKCPKCGADPTRPQFRHLVVPLVVCHYLAEKPDGKILGNGAMYELACNPAATEAPTPPVGQATNDFSCVTCPDCKKSASWLAVASENLVANDYRLLIDIQKGRIELDPVDAHKADRTDEPIKRVAEGPDSVANVGT